MFMSQEINEISKALSGFQSELKQPKLNKDVKVTTKSGKNYSFKYADLSACVEAAAPIRVIHLHNLVCAFEKLPIP